jgi:hypothetical protein
VAVPGEGQIEIVLYRLFGSPFIEKTDKQGSAKSGGNLHIAQRWDVQIRIRVADCVPYPPGRFCEKQVFDECGRVGDDDPQEAVRVARSCLMRSDAGLPRCTFSLLEIR